jgi:hypothetical protein
VGVFSKKCAFMPKEARSLNGWVYKLHNRRWKNWTRCGIWLQRCRATTSESECNTRWSSHGVSCQDDRQRSRPWVAPRSAHIVQRRTTTPISILPFPYYVLLCQSCTLQVLYIGCYYCSRIDF